MASPPQEKSPSSTGQELHVLIAGLPRTGKSTGLNNIFDLDFPARLSPRPITEQVQSRKTSKNGISLEVTDIPGLAAADITRDDITLRDMKEVGKKNTFLLLLTLPVDQNNCITENYHNTLKNLTTIFGPKVWDWCLVLLTFSDKIRNNKFSSDVKNQEYVDYLKEHCLELQTVLQTTGARKPVELFEYADFKKFQDKCVDTIVAIPVGKDPKFATKKLFPLLSWTHEYQWTELAFMEIAKINKTIPQASYLRPALIQFRYGYFTLKDKLGTIAKAAAGGAAGGVVVGGATGAGVGTVMEPGVGTVLGGLLGGAIGTVVGGIAGAIGVATGAAAVIIIAHKINLERNRKKTL